MNTSRKRDPLAAALAALKAYFVEPAPELAPPAPRASGFGPEPAAGVLPPAGYVEQPAVDEPTAAAAVTERGPAVDPAQSDAPPPPSLHATAPPYAARLRPVVAVFGLAPGCGASTVARALALELAARDPARVAAVRCEPRRGRTRPPMTPAWLAASPLSGAPVGRLAGALADFPGAEVRTVGRLCLVAGAERAGLAEGVPHLAALVLDEGSVAVGGVAAAVADRSVVVTTPSLEPALAMLAAECIARVGPDPIVVVNRMPESGATPAGSPHASSTTRSDLVGAARLTNAVFLPESRLGARFALRGKEPRGELQRAIVRLADRCLS